jgi:hypothetical protein
MDISWTYFLHDTDCSHSTTAVFYNHFEVNMLKSIPGVGSILAWVNLIGMNVGGASITLSISRHVYK